MKLRVRFLIILSAVSLLNICVFGLLFKHMVDERIEERLQEALHGYFLQSVSIVHNTLNTVANDMNLIASDGLTIGFFAAKAAYRNSMFQTELGHELQRFIRYNEDYLAVAILMPDGQETILRDRDNYVSRSVDAYAATLIAAFESSPAAKFSIQYSKVNDSYVLFGYLPIFKSVDSVVRDTHQVIGLVRITVRMDLLFQELYSKTFDTVFLTDQLAIFNNRSEAAGLLQDASSKEQLLEHGFYVQTEQITPSITLATVTPKKFWVKEGQAILMQSLVLVVMATSGFTLLFFLLLSRQILLPIEKFSRLLVKIHPSSNLSEYLPDRQDEIGLLQRRFQDLMQRLNRSSEVLEQQAYTDSLTGLPNRAALYKLLEQHMTRRQEPSFAILFLDLDGFKKINDFYGHKFGDHFLKKVTERLNELVVCEADFNVRSLSIDAHYLFRLGGDEFTIVLPDKQQAAIVANKIVKRFQHAFNVNGQLVYAGTSIGVAYCPEHSTEASHLLQQADMAMYAAKRQGKMRYQLFNQELEEIESQRQHAEYMVRKAVDQTLYQAHFQARVDTETGQIVGFDALARLADENGEMIPPVLFIPIAQEQGVLDQVTFAVLEQSCQLLQQLDNPELIAAINIVPMQLNDIRLLATLRHIMWQYQVSPRQIELELTEDQIIQEGGSVERNLTMVRRFGFRTALDDFGVSHSSIKHLRLFHFDTLKLDRIFINQNDYSSETAQAIINAILTIAKTLKMGIVAEGIETEEQLTFLRQVGIVVAQGFHIARPVSREAFIRLYQHSSRLSVMTGHSFT